jgi:hypothetical protein
VNRVRVFLLVEAIAFAAAALVHAGLVTDGHQHRQAMIAESVIAVILMLGLLASITSPPRSREAGLLAQGFALAGTCVGIFTMVIGIGPQSAFDVALHAGFVTLLTTGLTVVARGAHSLSAHSL